jgi:ribonuclease HI
VVLTEHRLRHDPVVRKLVTRSQYLRGYGVEVELRWVPGHSLIEGNVRADAAARYARMNSDLGVAVDEGLRLIEIEAMGKNNGQQQRSAIQMVDVNGQK